MSRGRILQRRRARVGRDSAQVDVTAFLSLMVILIPFLLISAVFSGITILELRAPADNAAQPVSADLLQLRLVVRAASIEVGFAGQGRPVLVNRTADGDDWVELATLLADLKRRFPDGRDATILLEPQIPYAVLVQVMDSVRIKPLAQDEGRAQQPLFPNLVLGEVVATLSPGPRQ